jgi:phage tail P2-like protein
MNNYGITRDNLLRTLPDVLKNDKKMCALATVIADLLSGQVGEIRKLKIYSQIDSLPEPLLDILAYDFKVDWYGYDYDIDVKRAQLKDSFNVRRHLGTRGAVERALSDIYPGTEVEEWFDYGGDPYHFRVLLDVTDQRVSLSHDEIIRAIEMFKSRRSHLQDNTVIYRSRVRIVIGVTTGYVLYEVRLCGTYPVRATQGAITNEDIILDTDSGGVAYAVPMSGEIKTGSHPAVATQGEIQSSGIEVGANGNGVAYSAPMCGTAPGSLM